MLHFVLVAPDGATEEMEAEVVIPATNMASASLVCQYKAKEPPEVDTSPGGHSVLVVGVWHLAITVPEPEMRVN